MDSRTGEVISAEDYLGLKIKSPEEAKHYIEVKSGMCTCGSKKEFKDCCFKKFAHLPRAERRKQIRKFLGCSAAVNSLKPAKSKIK